MSARWSALATYNGERARGLVHTTEWQERMASEQAAFDAERAAFAAELRARWDALPTHQPTMVLSPDYSDPRDGLATKPEFTSWQLAVSLATVLLLFVAVVVLCVLFT